MLKAARPETRIVVAEPDNAPVLSGGIAQPPPCGVVPTSHPAFRPHPIQGTSPDFIGKLTGDALDAGLVDEVVPMNGGEAMRLARELATREGIFAGISAGAALAAALKVAERAEPGATILCMLPDTGERYLSTPLFEDVSAEMSAEELAISRSSPLCRFDAPPAPPAAGAPQPWPMVDVEAEAFVAASLADPANPVVMFALEWCEFCWSARRLFQAMSIPFRSVDLDSVAYQEGDLGGRIRSALQARTGISTIPQIFIGGDFVGGASDVIAAAVRGDLQGWLSAAEVPHTAPEGLDPLTFLPRWLTRPAA